MAYSSTVLLALLVLSAASSAVHSATILGTVVGQVTALGSVVCAATTPVLAGVPGLNVSVSFNGGQLALGAAVTAANGTVSISAKTPGVALLDALSGIATIKIPSGVCGVVSPNATVIVPLSLNGITITAADTLAKFTLGLTL